MSAELFVGIDIGSTTGKGVILNHKGSILASTIREATPRPEETARLCLDDLFTSARVSGNDVSYMVGTGYGRIRISRADENISEITCHATGAIWLCPSVRTVLDIGGQDCKAIGVRDDGKVREFAMNDKCAAGTGRFLEGMARVLRVSLDDLSSLSTAAQTPALISSQCSVFAESEVITQLNEGTAIENIVAGIHIAIASRLVTLLKRVGIERDLTVSGGCAKNKGLLAALEDKIGVTVVPLKEDPQLVGAIGAALLAREKWQKGKGKRRT